MDHQATIEHLVNEIPELDHLIGEIDKTIKLRFFRNGNPLCDTAYREFISLESDRKFYNALKNDLRHFDQLTRQ